jgi:signal transduction histidine kinase
MLEEANRLTRLVDSLLMMSRADAGRIPLQYAEFPLLDLAKEAAGVIEVLAEEKNQSFDRFYRVDKSRSREEGGAGLGLSISEWAVRAHGGRIELDCDCGPGCTFRIRVPIGQNANRKMGERSL